MGDRDVKFAKEMLERCAAIGELMEPEQREQWNDGVVAKLQDLYAFEAEWNWSERFGLSLVLAIARARPLALQKMPPDYYAVALGGRDHAEAIWDLDQDRGVPRSSERRESIQRLADFIVSAAGELHLGDQPLTPTLMRGLANFALGKGDGARALGVWLLGEVSERWPIHVEVTSHRWALEIGSHLAQRERASKPRQAARPRGAAAMLIAAVWRERPGLRGKTFAALVAELRGGDTWGDVSIENMAITFERSGAGKRGWVGSVFVYVGTEDPREVKAKALERALERARKAV